MIKIAIIVYVILGLIEVRNFTKLNPGVHMSGKVLTFLFIPAYKFSLIFRKHFILFLLIALFIFYISK